MTFSELEGEVSADFAGSVELEESDEPPHADNALMASAQVMTANLFEFFCT